MRIWVPDADERLIEQLESIDSSVAVSERARADAWAVAPSVLQSENDARLTIPDAPGWIQLASSGIDSVAGLVRANPQVTWTTANDAFAQPVAEHALMLVLASLRELARDARATTWSDQHGRSLFGADVVIVGAGAIARSLSDLLRPFDVRLTVIRRSPSPVDFADVTTRDVSVAVAGADVVVLAIPLTATTRGIIDRSVLSLMKPDAALVNVGRGALVDSDALVDALARGRIGGVALDVTDPEPLPVGHPLWGHPRVLITPHTANPPAVSRARLNELVVDNVRRRLAGRPLRNLLSLSADS